MRKHLLPLIILILSISSCTAWDWLTGNEPQSPPSSKSEPELFQCLGSSYDFEQYSSESICQPTKDIIWTSKASGSIIQSQLNSSLEIDYCNSNMTSKCAGYSSSTDPENNYAKFERCGGEESHGVCLLWRHHQPSPSNNYDNSIITSSQIKTILNTAICKTFANNRPYCSCQSMDALLRSIEVKAQQVTNQHGLTRRIWIESVVWECCGQCK